MTQQVKPIPEGSHSITPYLVVNGAGEAIDFYKQFGWEIFDTRKFQLGTKIEDDFLMRIQLK